MKNIFIYFILIFSLHAKIVDIHPPRQIGDLSVFRPISLKDIFDAGFRPQSVINSTCITGPVAITLFFGENKSYLFEGSRMDLSVDRNNNISMLGIDSQIISVIDAEIKLRHILKINEIQPIALDSIIDEMKRNVSKSSNWNQSWEKNFIVYHVSLRSSLHTYYNSSGNVSNELKSVISFSTRWKTKEMGPTFRTKPIVPPVGYEHVSMKLVTPEDIVFAQNSDDPGLAHLKYPPEVWAQMLAERGLSPSPAPIPLTSRPPPKTKSSIATPVETLSPSKSFPWLFALTASAVMIALLWLLKRLRSKV